MYDGLCGEIDMTKRKMNLPGMIYLVIAILATPGAPQVDASGLAPAEDQIASAILAAPEIAGPGRAYSDTAPTAK